jgi:hypothetical protein
MYIKKSLFLIILLGIRDSLLIQSMNQNIFLQDILEKSQKKNFIQLLEDAVVLFERSSTPFFKDFIENDLPKEYSAREYYKFRDGFAILILLLEFGINAHLEEDFLVERPTFFKSITKKTVNKLKVAGNTLFYLGLFVRNGFTPVCPCCIQPPFELDSISVRGRCSLFSYFLPVFFDRYLKNRKKNNNLNYDGFDDLYEIWDSAKNAVDIKKKFFIKKNKNIDKIKKVFEKLIISVFSYYKDNSELFVEIVNKTILFNIINKKDKFMYVYKNGIDNGIDNGEIKESPNSYLYLNKKHIIIYLRLLVDFFKAFFSKNESLLSQVEGIISAKINLKEDGVEYYLRINDFYSKEFYVQDEESYYNEFMDFLRNNLAKVKKSDGGASFFYEDRQTNLIEELKQLYRKKFIP